MTSVVRLRTSSRVRRLLNYVNVGFKKSMVVAEARGWLFRTFSSIVSKQSATEH